MVKILNKPSTTLGMNFGPTFVSWALVDNFEKNIIATGTRYIKLGLDEVNEYRKGNPQTKNKERGLLRTQRKSNKRYKQRRNKLIYILKQIDCLPHQVKLSEEFSDPCKIQKILVEPIKPETKQMTALELMALRVRALTEKIDKKELGKLLYTFNQLRGYAGGESVDISEESEEDDEATKKYKKIVQLVKIVDIIKQKEETDKKKKQKIKIKIETEDGKILDGNIIETGDLKIGDEIELQLNIKRNPKTEEIISVDFSIPKVTSWRKKLEELEETLEKLKAEKGREVYISEYFLSLLQKDKWTRIRNNTILRSRYQAEFDAIWKEQSKHHKFLNNTNKDTLSEIASFLFPGTKETQIKYRKEAIDGGLYDIIKKQIIYYQRELKDQSDLISNCMFEPTEKVVAKSHPIFQEYKIWEQINKLSVNTKSEIGIKKNGEKKYDYVDKPLPFEMKEWLYEELQDKKEIKFSTILNKLKKDYNFQENIDFLNGMSPKGAIKGNDTNILLKKKLGSLWGKLELDNTNNLIEFWNVLYNGKGSEYELSSPRTSEILRILKKNNIKEEVEKTAIKISKIKFQSAYSSLSLKTIENVLALSKAGKYYEGTYSLHKLSTENVEDSYKESVQEYLDKNPEIFTHGGLLDAYAKILLYGKHTAKEYSEDEIINNINDIKRISKGSLRNPIVEKQVNEGLMIIKDIWNQYGKPKKINIQLAREMQNSAAERKKIDNANRKNEAINKTIVSTLNKLGIELTQYNIKKYKLWSMQAINRFQSDKQFTSDTEKEYFMNEKGHISPFTGKPIPLSKLFTEKYNIAHIFAESRYFSDDMSNLVICETEVNSDMDNRIAMEYIESGSIQCMILSKDKYVELVNNTYFGNKRKNLLSPKIPQDPIKRLLKDTQYITVKIKEEANKIFGNNNVMITIGAVTDYLINYWGIIDDLKKMSIDRFKQLEKNNPYEQWISTTTNNGKKTLKLKNWSKQIDHRYQAASAAVVACTEPSYINKLNDLNKQLQDWLAKNYKQITANFKGTDEERLEIFLNLAKDKKDKILKEMDASKHIDMPWNNFSEDVIRTISNILVSHKPKDEISINRINKNSLTIKARGPLHKSTIYGGKKGKECYRIPLLKLGQPTVSTEKVIERIIDPFYKKMIKNHLLVTYKGDKKEAFSADGIKVLNSSFKNRSKKNSKGETIIVSSPPIYSITIYYKNQYDLIKIEQLGGKKINIKETIKTFVDENVKSIIINHLNKFEGDSVKAFSLNGIKEMNEGLAVPIKSIKVYSSSEENEEGDSGALQSLYRKRSFNNKLYIQTGSNYCYVVMEDKNGKRDYDIISLFDATNIIKKDSCNVKNNQFFDKEKSIVNHFEGKPENKDSKVLFTLMKSDLVYMPQKNEILPKPGTTEFNKFWNDYENRSKNIYTVIKFSGKTIYFLRHDIARTIENKVEFGTSNCFQKVDGINIQDTCIPIKLNRLGQLIEVNKFKCELPVSYVKKQLA